MLKEKEWHLDKFKFNSSIVVFHSSNFKPMVHCSWMEPPEWRWSLELLLTFMVRKLLRYGLNWNSHSSRWNMASWEYICWLCGNVAVCCGRQCGGLLVMNGGSYAWQFRSWWYIEIKGDSCHWRSQLLKIQGIARLWKPMRKNCYRDQCVLCLCLRILE